ncbi:precorrin-2 dehydrogenase/sirohydrochlorin ferrochelatase family protein [Curtanaerobium respiraculi]|uniref:precorrin-2 dehydrogenase/sirohydrochlorin ferrochelatase family protein n=1 Tax=Curtanaerobium respiraculi TaxID=2949669 RepID=UPI0024B34F16|nr:bifunctional precorrin-2 dehydrogenase/sirohydrochlorin ferrochelatase [Curtanaerobium respiraculi]
MQSKRGEGSRTGAGYPIFVDLNQRRVVVIGGGSVAERKIATLLEFGADVRVVSPEVTDPIARLAAEGGIELRKRVYEPGDLEGAFLAICTCGKPEEDARVHDEARRRNCLLNVADVPSECDFILPSFMSRGRLQIAVSTNGSACTEAKNIRRHLEEEYDESWEAYLDLLYEMRQLVKQRIEGQEEHRKPIFEAATRVGFRQRLAAGEDITAEDAYAEAVRAARED